jgi:hypothetical protein
MPKLLFLNYGKSTLWGYLSVHGKVNLKNVKNGENFPREIITTLQEVNVYPSPDNIRHFPPPPNMVQQSLQGQGLLIIEVSR